jgi:hypothetical protein
MWAYLGMEFIAQTCNYFVAMFVVLKWMPVLKLFVLRQRHLHSYISLRQSAVTAPAEHNCQHFDG